MVICLATLTPSSSPPLESDSHPLCIVCGTVGGVDVLLNLALFTPLGLGLGLARLRWSMALSAVAALTVVIEGLQMFLVAGRDASVGDLLMNAAGGVVGFLAGRRFDTLVAPRPAPARLLISMWAALWLALQAVSAYAMTPRPPRSAYFGQIAPTLGGMARLDGVVLSARVGSWVIGDGALGAARSRDVRDLLLRGSPSIVVSVWRSPSDGIAPVFRIADDSGREVLSIAQDGDDVIFGVRTGANVLRLRPIRLRIRDVRGSAERGRDGDTVHVTASYAPGRAFVGTDSRAGARELRTRVGASQGWRLFLPLQTYVETGAWTIAATVAWILALMMPMGYWSVWLTPGASRRPFAALRASVIPLTAFAVGGTVVPSSFGVQVAGVPEWVAGVLAVSLGVALSRTVMRIDPADPARVPLRSPGEV